MRELIAEITTLAASQRRSVEFVAAVHTFSVISINIVMIMLPFNRERRLFV